jgi:hypothetical protein
MHFLECRNLATTRFDAGMTRSWRIRIEVKWLTAPPCPTYLITVKRWNNAHFSAVGQ